jgi:hypothetical protein
MVKINQLGLVIILADLKMKGKKKIESLLTNRFLEYDEPNDLSQGLLDLTVLMSESEAV